jgi:predicted esterase
MNKPIYIWSGEKDKTIPTFNQEQQLEFYEHYDAKVSFNEIDIGHQFEDNTFKDGLNYHLTYEIQFKFYPDI